MCYCKTAIELSVQLYSEMQDVISPQPPSSSAALESLVFCVRWWQRWQTYLSGKWRQFAGFFPCSSQVVKCSFVLIPTEPPSRFCHFWLKIFTLVQIAAERENSYGLNRCYQNLTKSAPKNIGISAGVWINMKRKMILKEKSRKQCFHFYNSAN